MVGAMMTTIRIGGCDDETTVMFDWAPEIEIRMRDLAHAINQARDYGCKPFMEVNGERVGKRADK